MNPHLTQICRIFLCQFETRILIVFLLILCINSNAQFSDESSDLGIDHIFIGTGYGGGVSLIDINGDGLDDLTLGTGAGYPLEVYLQNQESLELSFEPSLISIDAPVRSINWVDYDNDGDKDLFYSTAESSQADNEFKLFEQNDIGQFIDVTESSGIDPPYSYSFGSAWADYDRDGFLDLYINTRTIGDNGANYMYHNLGDGTFEDVAADLGLQDHQGHSFTSVFFDADLDGIVDLFTANDRTNSFNRFYRGLADGTFLDMSEESNLYICMDAMGTDIGDYDSDGDLDIYVTNTSGGQNDSLLGNILFRNDGNLQFTALSNFPFGVDVGSFWGCSFFDYNNDRETDLFTVATWSDHPNGTNMFLFENTGAGNYVSYEGGEFNSVQGFHYGSAHGDLNSDGWPDLVVTDSYVGGSQVWMATLGGNNWIKFHLEGTQSNRDAIGSLIAVWSQGEKRIDFTTCGNSYISQDSDNYTFGLGTASSADSVIVHWPNGHVNVIYDLAAGERYVIIEDVETYEISFDQNCSDSFSAPVELSDTFHPVNGLLDRFQLKWYKEAPEIRYSDEDAAACDIRFWAIQELDPLTGDPIGFPFKDPDTLAIHDTKKFYTDGSARSIYKWPVKFRAEVVNHQNRVAPNLRYEWKVRCSCGHGLGPESDWSEIASFDTPDFDTETGVFTGAGKIDLGVSKNEDLSPYLDCKVTPNPISNGQVELIFRTPIEEPIRYRIMDLSGRELCSGIQRTTKADRMSLFLDKRIHGACYIIEIITQEQVITKRFIVSDE